MLDIDDVVAPDSNKKYTIQEIEELFIINRIGKRASHQTIIWYEGMFRPFNRYMKTKGVIYISDLNGAVIDDYVTSITTYEIKRRQGELLSDTSAHGRARAVRALLRFALRRQYIRNEIYLEMPKVHKKENRVLTAEEVKTLIRVAKTLREKTAVALAVDSGLRISEMAALRWRDIDTRSFLIKVVHGKGDKFRMVAAGGKTISLLLQLKQSLWRNGPDDGVFQSHTSEPLTRWGLRAIYEDLSNESGIQFSAHALRRTCAKFSIQNGMDIVMVQQLLGHDNVETTRHYIQELDPTFIQESHRKHGVIDHL